MLGLSRLAGSVLDRREGGGGRGNQRGRGLAARRPAATTVWSPGFGGGGNRYPAVKEIQRHPWYKSRTPDGPECRGGHRREGTRPVPVTVTILPARRSGGDGDGGGARVFRTFDLVTEATVVSCRSPLSAYAGAVWVIGMPWSVLAEGEGDRRPP